MIEIVNFVNNAKFSNIKNWANAKITWDKLNLVHGRDDNVRRIKFERLKGKYNDMTMEEG